MERSLTRLIADVRKTEQTLRREVDDLERETSPSHVVQNVTSGTRGGKSLVKLKSEKLEKTRALRLAQADAGLLSNVVRLADYMLVEGALDMLVSVIRGFCETMESKPVIVAQLSFAEVHGMSFNANEEEARQVRGGNSRS